MDHLMINRGFESHVGYLHGAEDYHWGDHNQSTTTQWNKTYEFHKDMWHDKLPGTDVVDEIFYSTNWYTSRAISIISDHPPSKHLWLHLPYQAVHAPYEDTPQWETMPASCPFWDHTFGDMLAVVDKGIANVTDAMQAKGLWDETIAVFSSGEAPSRAQLAMVEISEHACSQTTAG